MAEVLIGVVLGGIVSLVSALTIDTARARREDRQRWDRDRLAAAVEFVGAAQDLAGDQYRRGRATADESVPRDEKLRRDDEARRSLSELWIAATKARLLLPDAEGRIEDVVASARLIRDLADDGIASGDPRWKALRQQHQEAIEAFSDACRLPLGIARDQSRVPAR